jgi:hypothetical protein
VRANTPPTAAALLIRSSIIGGWDRLEDLWREWENWFFDAAETQTSLPARVFNPDPHWPEDPISIERREFDQVCLQLAEAGVPLKAGLDQAWRDFAGCRVNYDRVLLRWPR